MDKKGFTLVELLAVIVILSVILVIAVPKITDTINNTKMSSLETSVKLIAKRAESYIEEQAMLGNTVPDTFDCSVVSQVNNTDYPTCSIKRIGTKALVNVTGGGKFLGKYIYNGTKDVVEVQNTELTTLATNVIANSGNVNIDETGDKNIRYSGTDPSNYVYFNCSDYSSQNDTNCEKWRIIGIFNIDNGEGVIEQRVKIIGPSLGDYSWDTTPVGVNGGYGYNIWETKTTTTPKSTQDSSTKADVNRLLNEVYLEGSNSVLCYDDINNHPKGCPSALRNSPTTKEYISNAVWNLGGTSWKIVNNLNYLPTLDTYNKERGSLTGNGFSNIAKTTWTGMVGLPCMSDFVMQVQM